MLTKKILLQRILPALILTTLIISFLFINFGRKSQSNLSNANFSLVDINGQQFSKNQLIGKPSLLFFGFLNCPDVCPSSLQLLSNLIEDLGPDASKINYYFVSVDPERDSPSMLRDFLGSFHPRILGVSGKNEELEKLYNVFGIYVKKVPLKNNYTIDHTASFMILDSKGKKVGELLHEDFTKFTVLDIFGKIQTPKDAITDNLKKLLKIN